MLLAAGTGAAEALCPVEPLASEQSLLCGGGGGGGTPRQCTAALPVPADAFDCQCKTINIDPSMRCQEPLPQDQCTIQINNAFSFGLITSNAVTFLQSNGFCPIILDLGAGPRIFSFCPVGCFASDTRILTSGTSGYTPASELTAHDTLMGMADDATLRDVGLTALPIKRIVHGPEKPPLYVFGLANGATLRVTQHHPMILASGKIIEASQVARDMSFVGANGRPVAITSITREQAVGDVFNFETAGDTQLSHVIVAEGVLVGDLKLQNELAAEEHSINLRR